MNKNNLTSKWKSFCRWLKAWAMKLAREPQVKITCTLAAAVIGGILGAYFQEKSWKEQYQLSMMESDRKQAEEIFNEVSQLMDDRYYKTRRLLSAYIDNDTIKIKKSTTSLVSQLEEWNANRNRVPSLLEAYYGKEIKDFYEKNIHFPFARLGNGILSPKEEKSEAYLIKSRNDLESIRIKIRIMDKMMLDAIMENKIGRFSKNDVK